MLYQYFIYCRNINECAICIVTYGLVRFPNSKVLQEALLNQKFNMVILDESHYMKNRKSATARFLVPLVQQARRKILLTGTPALARPEEVTVFLSWHLLDWHLLYVITFLFIYINTVTLYCSCFLSLKLCVIQSCLVTGQLSPSVTVMPTCSSLAEPGAGSLGQSL